MTQTASRSKFKFIPKPIEQQLGMYQTGEHLDFYQWGWVRKPKGDKKGGSPKLWGSLCTLVGLATTIGAAKVLNDAESTMYIRPIAAALVLVVPLLLLFVGPFLFLQSPPFCVLAFHDSLIFVKKQRVIALYWHEIVSYENKLITRHWMPEMSNTIHVYTIRARDGRKLRWKVTGHGMEELSNIINEHIA